MQARREEADARATIDQLRREAQSRGERLGSIDLEERAWRKRAESAATQRETLDQRRRELEQEIAALAGRPAVIAADSEMLGAEVATAARNAGEATDRLALGESRLREATQRSRVGDQALAEARECRARLEVQAAAAQEAVAALAREIAERLGAEPAELPQLAGLDDGQAPPEATASAERLDRLTRERAGIGPVNLVAEGEAAEIGAQVEALERERADLTEAIAKLRRGAHELDQQGRELLAAAFERVNRHFADLFTRLFGGGKAELALTDDGDPLTAGLEIMASPTGKRLQSLSLLSGGEQALTALALLFAVFLTKPAPICVLDEVDAPLDDANVDRLVQPGSGYCRHDRHALFADHPPSHHDGARRPAVWGDNGRARGLAAGLGRSRPRRSAATDCLTQPVAIATSNLLIRLILGPAEGMVSVLTG